MKTVKRFVVAAALVFGLATPALAPTVVYAQNTLNDDGLCDGANLSFSGGGECAGDEAATRVDSIIQTVINIISIIVGIVAVIMIIIGGFQYITSSGDSGKVSNAKNTILYAIVGLVVVALAQIIVRFVVNRLTTDTGTGG